MKYKIVEIMHSGRGGLRYTWVTDPKYDGVVGSIVTIKGSIEDIKQYSFVKMDFVKTDSLYDYWITSEVLKIMKDTNERYSIETANAIYVLEELDE